MQLVSQEFKAKNGLYIEKSFKDGEMNGVKEIIIQKENGEVLYMGSPKDLSDLIDAVNEDLAVEFKEETI